MMNSGAPRPSFSRNAWVPNKQIPSNFGRIAHINQNFHREASASHQSIELSPKSPIGLSSAASSSSIDCIASHSSVEKFLHTHGLSEYLERFMEEGFDRIDSIEAITEDDMESMNVKRGHRRILQRALAARRRLLDTARHIPVHGSYPDHSQNITSTMELCTPPGPVSKLGSDVAHRAPSNPIGSLSDHKQKKDSRHRDLSLGQPNQQKTHRRGSWGESEMSVSEGISEFSAAQAPVLQCGNTKRRYRRRPKFDQNAPEKPLSAYVLFSNSVREELKGQSISFTDIARLVGDRWKNLDPGSKELIVRQAAEAKSHWIREMDEYKKTPEYVMYQKYLKEFKESSGKSRGTISQPTNLHGITKVSPVQPIAYRPEPWVEPRCEERMESDADEDSWSDSQPEVGEQKPSKRIRTSMDSSVERKAVLHPPDLNQAPHALGTRVLTLPTILTQVNHVRAAAIPQSVPRQALLSATNNTFFENPSRSLRLPANLQHMETLAASRDRDEDSRL